MEGLPPGDINTKYQKLAAEYSKLRIHVKVLKKGVLDEQAKSSELKELLKEREKASRKAELEIDSLNFRNQQLTKRISVLQDEIESVQLKNTKKGKPKNAKEEKQASTSHVFDNGLLQEEFQKKIFENAQLACQLSDSNFEVMQIRTRLEDMEKFLNESECKYKCEIAKLKNINQELLYSLENTCPKDKHNFSNRHMLASTSNHQIPSVNGDFFSEGGSLIGSEDALSSVDINEQLCLKNDALEKENHRLKMECELLKMENEQYRLASMKTSTSSNRRSRSDYQDFGDFSSVSYSNVHPDGILTSLLGTVSIPFILSNEILQREENMKKYYRDKMTAFTMEKQKLESMAQHHEGECEAFRQRLEDAEKERESNIQMFQVTQDTISRLEDELHSTSTNYEQQLSLLTEHTGNLNDKLAQQFEEIQSLKSALSRKK